MADIKHLTVGAEAIIDVPESAPAAFNFARLWDRERVTISALTDEHQRPLAIYDPPSDRYYNAWARSTSNSRRNA